MCPRWEAIRFRLSRWFNSLRGILTLHSPYIKTLISDTNPATKRVISSSSRVRYSNTHMLAQNQTARIWKIPMLSQIHKRVYIVSAVGQLGFYQSRKINQWATFASMTGLKKFTTGSDPVLGWGRKFRFVFFFQSPRQQFIDAIQTYTLYIQHDCVLKYQLPLHCSK